MSRRGGSRPRRLVTLPCMEQCLLASRQESSSPCYPAGAGAALHCGYALGAAVRQSPKAEAGSSFTWCQEPALPSDPGLWRLPLLQEAKAGSSATGHWMAAVGLWLLQDCPPDAWLPTSMGWHTGKGEPRPSARKGQGCSLGLLATTATKATFSEAQVKPLDFRHVNAQTGLRASALRECEEGCGPARARVRESGGLAELPAALWVSSEDLQCDVSSWSCQMDP